jgi:hypothetical protein
MAIHRYILHVLDPDECLDGYGAVVVTIDDEARVRLIIQESLVRVAGLAEGFSHAAFCDDRVSWRHGIEDTDFHDRLFEADMLPFPEGPDPLAGAALLSVDSSTAILTFAGVAWEARIGSNVIETSGYIPWETLLEE